MSPRLLIVEDEPKTARQLVLGLSAAGYDTTLATDGDEALAKASGGDYDALVLDVMLPRRSGLEVVRELRRQGQGMPVLFLSARDAPTDRIQGLEAGGDDYLGKPYAFPEVVARVRALLRRWPLLDAAGPAVTVADLEWEPEHRRVSRAGHRIDLTPKEYALCELLLENRGEVVTRAQIAERVWGLGVEAAGNGVDVQVRRLRAKLDDPYGVKLIHTLRGVGVVLEARG